MKNGTCPKCNGTEILQLEEVTDQVGARTVGLAQEPYVCGSCGYIEFYACDLKAVRAMAHVRKSPAAQPFR